MSMLVPRPVLLPVTSATRPSRENGLEEVWVMGSWLPEIGWLVKSKLYACGKGLFTERPPRGSRLAAGRAGAVEVGVAAVDEKQLTRRVRRARRCGEDHGIGDFARDRHAMIKRTQAFG